MTNPFEQGIEFLDPRDVPLVYAAGITGATEQAMDYYKVEPAGRPCTSLTVGALRVIEFDPFPIATKVNHILMLSLEALAAVMASAQVQIDTWDDATRTRFRWMLDQHTAAARQAQKEGPAGGQ